MRDGEGQHDSQRHDGIQVKRWHDDRQAEDQRETGVNHGRANTRINIAGVGTLYLRRSIWNSSGVQVYALQLVLSTAQGGLPAGAVVTAGVAHSGVRYH